MTVKELKEKINDLPDEMEVIMLENETHDKGSPLYGVNSECLSSIGPESFMNRVYSDDCSHEQAGMSWSSWEELKTKPRVLVLQSLSFVAKKIDFFQKQ